MGSLFKFLLQRLAVVLVTLIAITAIIYGIILMAPIEARARLYMGERTRPFMPPDIEKRFISLVDVSVSLTPNTACGMIVLRRLSDCGLLAVRQAAPVWRIQKEVISREYTA